MPSAKVLNLQSYGRGVRLWMRKRFNAFRKKEERKGQTFELKDKFRSKTRLRIDSY